MKQRAHVYIVGKVQGVFFRAWATQKAKKFDLCGWVRNVDDGKVEIVAEGERVKINSLIKALKKGPPLSKVKNIEIIWEKTKEEFEGFNVIR